MDYKKIISVTGMPGLFELISSKNDGAIIRSLKDGTTQFASNRSHQFSQLDSIEIYTLEDNVNLADVFAAMKESEEKLPPSTDNKALKSYFEKVFPHMDFERVYSSDMKKMVRWYEILAEKEIDFKAQGQDEIDEKQEGEGKAEVEGKVEVEDKGKVKVEEKGKVKAEGKVEVEGKVKAEEEVKEAKQLKAEEKTEEKPKAKKEKKAD